MEKYAENLRFFFNDYAYIEGISIKEGNIAQKIDADVIVASNQIIFNYVNSLVSNSSQVVYIDVSFYKHDIEKRNTIPEGTSVLLADYSDYTSISLAALLNEFGIHHIDFIP